MKLTIIGDGDFLIRLQDIKHVNIYGGFNTSDPPIMRLKFSYDSSYDSSYFDITISTQKAGLVFIENLELEEMINMTDAIAFRKEWNDRWETYDSLPEEDSLPF